MTFDAFDTAVFATAPEQLAAGHRLASPDWGAPVWAGSTSTLAVRQFTLRHPFVYAGRNLSPRWEVAIDIDLPAASEGLAGRPGVSSYAQMTSRQRLGYLQWLAQGCSASLSDDAPLRVFLAGMEEFLLTPRAKGQDTAEVDAALGMLRQIQVRYEATHGHLTDRFLALHDFCRLRRLDVDGLRAYQDTGYTQRAGATPSMGLRFALGQLVLDDKKLPARWAYQWSKCLLSKFEAVNLPVYEDLLRRLFIQMYVQEFGEGLSLSGSNRGQLDVSYGAIGPVLRTRTFQLAQSAPIIGYEPDTSQKLATLLGKCRDELLDYASQRRRGVAEADCWSCLPVTLWPDIHRYAFRTIVEQALEAPYVTSYAQMAPYFNLSATFHKVRLDQLSAHLREFGLGTQPDFQFKTRPKSAAELFALFADAAQLPEYDEHALAFERVLRLCATQFAPDSPNWALVAQRLTRHARAPHLSRELCQRRRADILLVQGGQFKRATHAVLGKLGLDEQTAVRELAQSLLEPTHSLPATPLLDRVLGADWRTTPPTAPLELSLDHAKVAQLTDETRQVQSLLGTVFQFDAGGPTPAPMPTFSAVLKATGPTATSPRAAFLQAMATRDIWPQCELDEMAHSLALMAGGTLEWANDLAYSHFEAPVFEEEPAGWRVDQCLLTQLLATEPRE